MHMTYNVIMFMFFLSTTSSQMFDLSSGDTSQLKLFCGDIDGDWDVENAQTYDPNLSGKVLTSALYKYSCLTLKSQVNIEQETRFHLMIYLKYTAPIVERFTVEIVKGRKRYIWLEIATKSPRWFEESYPLPVNFKDFGIAQVELKSKTFLSTASIRYFALSTELSFTTTTAEPTEPTTEPSLDPTYTESNTESTTAFSNTEATEPITESSTEPSLEPTIGPITDPSTELITEFSDTDTTEPITEPTTESITEPSLEPTTQSFEPNTGPITEPTTDLTTEFSNTNTTEPNTEPMNDSTTNDQEEPTTPESTNTEFITNPTTAYVPPHVHNTGFTLDLWSIVVGFCIGLVFVVLAVLFGTCVWWLLFVACSKKDRKPDYNDVALPRLRQRQNYPGPDIRAGYY